MNVYRLLGQDIPRELYEPIKKKIVAGFVREPTAYISPHIDGLVTDYFEWLAAGLFDLSRQSSAMHVSESSLQSFFYGYDTNLLYFRIDGVKPLDQLLQPEDILNLHLVAHDKEFRLPMGLHTTKGALQSSGKAGAFKSTRHSCSWGIKRVCEAAIPLSALNLLAKEPLKAYLTLVRGHEELGRWPVDAPMELKYFGVELELTNWLI
jgi:hypothetical protein